jgi:5-oxoprolinase (ATP-hydrolysing) subunit A
MHTIDLNADIAEGFPNDLELMNFVSSINICSGAYAGSPELSTQTFAMGREKGLRVGAHVGFPDRQSMGRRELSEGYPEEWLKSVEAQIRNSGSFSYIKPHGALYHWLANAPEDSKYVWGAIEEMEKPFMGMPNTGHEAQCRRRGLRFISEGFCERGYDKYGHLIPRSEPDAVIHDLDAICAQAIILAEKVDSICIHGDREDAALVAYVVRDRLTKEGYKITS